MLNSCIHRLCRQVYWIPSVASKSRHYERQCNEQSKNVAIYYKPNDRRGYYEDKLSHAIRMQLERRGILLCDRCNRQLVASIYSCLENDLIEKRKMAAMFDDLLSIIKSQLDHNKELMKIIKKSSTSFSSTNTTPSETVDEKLRADCDCEEDTVVLTKCSQKVAVPNKKSVTECSPKLSESQKLVLLKTAEDVDCDTTNKQTVDNPSSKNLVPIRYTGFNKDEECKRRDFYSNLKLEGPPLVGDKLDDNCKLALEKSSDAFAEPFSSSSSKPKLDAKQPLDDSKNNGKTCEKK